MNPVAIGCSFHSHTTHTTHTCARTHMHTHAHAYNSLEDVLGRHQQMQDEIADDMINMAHSLKHNSLVAKDIIINDTKA